MKKEIVITRTQGNWTFGRLGEYTFEVKQCQQSSEDFGLDFDGCFGRIIKLWVMRNFTTVCAFERGWDILPHFEKDQEACAEIIRRFN